MSQVNQEKGNNGLRIQTIREAMQGKIKDIDFPQWYWGKDGTDNIENALLRGETNIEEILKIQKWAQGKALDYVNNVDKNMWDKFKTLARHLKFKISDWETLVR